MPQITPLALKVEHVFGKFSEMARAKDKKAYQSFLLNIVADGVRFAAGKHLLIENTIGVMWRTRSAIFIITPAAVPEVVEILPSMAHDLHGQTFFYTTSWNLIDHATIHNLSEHPNIRLRQMKLYCDYWGVVQDHEEILFANDAITDESVECIISDDKGCVKFFNQFIGLMVMANSQPLHI